MSDRASLEADIGASNKRNLKQPTSRETVYRTLSSTAYAEMDVSGIDAIMRML